MILLIDMVVVGVCFMASVILSQVYMLRLDYLEKQIITDAFIALPIVLAIFMIYFWLFRIFKVVWRYARGKDYLRILGACLLGTFTFILLDELALHLVAKPGYELPDFIGKFAVYPAYFNFGFTSVCSLIIYRLGYEFIFSHIRDQGVRKNRKRTLIVGAGLTACTILEELSRLNSLYEPICMVDDDPDKRGRIIREIEVVGNTKQIPSVVQEYGIEVIIFAIPSIDDESRKRILTDCNKTKCSIKVLPYVSEMIENENYIKQMRDINICDLLGRPQVVFEDKGVEKYINDKVVMVTGGGGSIGSELCRQIAKYNPKRIVVVDVYENCVYDIQQELKIKYGNSVDFCAEILTITDYEKTNDVFDEYKPQIVFHAAAHKHVPLMETNPEEAVKNNIFGTYNVVKLSDIHNVEKFIMVSTDKAVNPTNVMGATKRCCEKIVQVMSKTKTKTEFAAVRFGNVLGSNGSVIPLFRRQIEAGGPITVTHKDIIRFFMTIPEAVSLVLQAGAFAHGGEIFVLDMGEQVKIVKLAENLITMMGYTPYVDIDIQFTGLRPGEKLYEEILMNEEGLEKTSNNKIFVGKQAEFDSKVFNKLLEDMRSICLTNDKVQIVEKLKQLVPTFKHDEKSMQKMLEKKEKLKKERETEAS